MKTILIILLVIIGLLLLWFVVALIKEIHRRRNIDRILIDKAVSNIMSYWENAPTPVPRKEKEEEQDDEIDWVAEVIDPEPIVTQEEPGLDERFDEVARFVVSEQTASRPALQRKLGMGYFQAGYILGQLEEAGIVGPENAEGERAVLVENMEGLEPILSRLASVPRNRLPFLSESDSPWLDNRQ